MLLLAMNQSKVQSVKTKTHNTNIMLLHAKVEEISYNCLLRNSLAIYRFLSEKAELFLRFLLVISDTDGI